MLPTPPLDRRVAILGATGSVGSAAVDVLRHLAASDRDCRWRLHGISGHANLAGLHQIACDLSPRRVVLSDGDCDAAARSPLDSWAKRTGARIDVGAERLVDLAADPEVDTVVAAIVGRAGVESTLAAVAAGKRVALANKETLVVAGDLVTQAAKQSGAELLPVDSEHSAIFQCLASGAAPARLVLTASGGPFRNWTVPQMQQATVDQALAHPTWQMGRKISIDSATMMNKALEIIEARWLFDIPADQIAVVIHPQSIIHSMVEMIDGSTLAQISQPDMRLPIQHALTFPRCLPGNTPRMDWSQASQWTMQPVDPERFPAISLGFEVARAGGTAGAVLNAANEAAVGLFLDGQIRFTDIVTACQVALARHNHEKNASIDRLLQLDRWAREEVFRWQALSN